MLQDVPPGQAYSQVHYGGGITQYFLIGSAQISWVAPEDSGGGGFNPPNPTVASPLGVSLFARILTKFLNKKNKMKYMTLITISFS